jgi:hypothetical protein
MERCNFHFISHFEKKSFDVNMNCEFIFWGTSWNISYFNCCWFKHTRVARQWTNNCYSWFPLLDLFPTSQDFSFFEFSWVLIRLLFIFILFFIEVKYFNIPLFLTCLFHELESMKLNKWWSNDMLEFC